MKFNLKQDAASNLMLVAHRGFWGGNIPCNTVPAFDTALRHGADMIEIDLDRTADGKLVIFHPGMEQALLGFSESIERMPYDFVKQLRYINTDDVPTQFGIEKFDDFLEHFKGRCFINVDKFWDNPEAIYEAVKRHGMTDQIVVKAPPTDEVLRVLRELAPTLAYMPVVKRRFDGHSELLKSNINYIGIEALFYDDGDDIVSEQFMDAVHKDGKLMWVNSIIYDCQKQIAAGHSDDTALTESEDKGWGWLADRGFDLIQTDWPMMLIDYLKNSGKYYR